MCALVVIILLAALILPSRHASASTPSDISTADLQTQAAQGDAMAQFDLGWMYLNGQGMPQDYTKAWDWFEKAAAQGNVKAQYALGALYSDWPSVRQSNVKGLMWLNIATARLIGAEQQEVAKNRDRVARHMSPAQIAEAQRLAQQCQAQQFKGC